MHSFGAFPLHALPLCHQASKQTMAPHPKLYRLSGPHTMALSLLHLALLTTTMASSLLTPAPPALVSASNATATDLSALLAFKHRLSDPGDVLRGNWTPGTPYCGWVGVSCGHRHRQRVTALALPGVRLAGGLAPELGNLSFLSSLNLSGTELTGYIPASLGKLPRLFSLDLSNNYLSGAVPATLGNLTALGILSLDSNNLTGEVPHELSNLRSVGFLTLSRNDLSGPLAQGLFNGTSSTQLSFLSLAHNSLTGDIPSAIASLQNLKVLELSGNQLSGQIPSSLFNMSSLLGLYLSRNHLSGPVPDNQSFNLPLLERVYLSKNELTGTVPPGFGTCKYLQQLVLSYNRFTGGIPPWLSTLPELTWISLGGNDLSGEIPAVLSNITGLTVLDFTTSRLHGEIPPELGRLAQLQWLNLEMNNLTGTIPASIRNLSMLSILDVSFNSLTGPVPRKLFGESLTELYIDENKLSGDVGFMADLSGCRSLKYIVMNSNSFAGSFPSSTLANLSSLQIFRAFENQITGHIPNMPGSVSFVDLRDNLLNGEIPQSITELRNLRGLDLSSNRLSGTIPAHIGKLTELFGLGLANNELHGPIPDSIGNLSNLQVLELSNNHLTSVIPPGLWGLDNIVGLDLSRNALRGSFPPEGTEDLKAITFMDLSSNQLHGKIPPSLGALSTLTYLNLSKNLLQDRVPSALGNKLSSMKTLDLSYNSLSGTIPESLANLSYLTSLNLSFNRLHGRVPEGGVFSNITLQSLEGNAALCGLPRLGLPRCPTDEFDGHRHRSGVLKIVLPSAAAAIVVGACLFILVRAHVNKRAKKLPVAASEEANNRKTVSYFELARATNGFDDGNLLGAGSFGKVFRGVLDDGQTVAVKVLDMELERATVSFDAECRALRMARHRNLVRILTACSNLDFRALVLPYMPNGSLDEWLLCRDRRGLSLSRRVSIMSDVALAVAYLHHEHFEVVLHCDLKPSNVLLDQDMTACVADFGIARLLSGDDTSVVSRNMQGTIGYMAPGT